MNFLNVDIPVKNVPELDKGFVPLGLFFKNYQKGAAKPLCIAVERSGGQIGTYETKIYGAGRRVLCGPSGQIPFVELGRLQGEHLRRRQRGRSHPRRVQRGRLPRL